MPYLTKIPINPRRRSSIRLLGNPHLIHGAVSAGFLTDPRDERLLWRIDAPDQLRPSLIVLSKTLPDYTHIWKDYGWPETEAAKPVSKDYTPLLTRLEVGQEYRFRLVANPVQHLRHPQKPTEAQQRRQRSWDSQTGTAAERKVRGHRVEHRTAAHQRNWLISKAASCGFLIPEIEHDAHTILDQAPGTTAQTDHQVALIERRRLHFRKRRDTEPIKIASATFEGRLRITDLEPFKQALLQGIGPAKAYGQGLLTLAPLPTAGA